MPSGTILIVDDEPTVRSFMEAILRGEGFHLLKAGDGLEALQQVEQRGAPVDLPVTDIRMPRMDGVALARALVESYPKTSVLYVSGYPFDLEQERLKNSNTMCGFLSKPFTRKTLVDAVRKCLHPDETVNSAAG